MRLLPIAIGLLARSTAAFVATPGRGRSMFSHLRAVTKGSIVTVDVAMAPEGDFVPDELIDTKGKLTFVLGGGNYIPGLHEIVEGMEVGSKVEGESLDAGWGSRNPNLIATIKKAEMGDQIDVSQIKEGVKLHLVNGMEALVTEVSEETFTIDANPPLAGSSYKVDAELLSIEDPPSLLEYTPEGNPGPFQVATFALGCFWGR